MIISLSVMGLWTAIKNNLRPNKTQKNTATLHLGTYYWKNVVCI